MVRITGNGIDMGNNPVSNASQIVEARELINTFEAELATIG